MIVRTFDGLQALTTPTPTWATSSPATLSLYDSRQAYAQIYRSQPNVRICVDFLARNIAQLAPHLFRRVSDTDRVRLEEHELARWLAKPNPSTRRYRLIETLIGDLGIYFEAFWLKVRYRDGAGRPAIGLVGLPPEEMRIYGGLLPTLFEWTSNGVKQPFPPSEIVYFNGYNPTVRLRGLSPLETLRRVLAEEAAAGDHRESYWRNASRMEGIWEQTKDAPNWTKEQQQSFREQWQEFAGSGSKVGMTAVGPRGMVYKQASFSARDSEYTLGGKLRREVCAAAYHIPQPMVGILDHATFSNIKEQHKHLYQDTLGPWLEMIQQEIEGQLLIECQDRDGVYIEFNIAAKLAGSFEEQASSLQALVGRPIMTANEGRARINLPSIKDDPSADQLAAQQGGPAATDQTPPGPGAAPPPSSATRGQSMPGDDGTAAAIEIGRTLEIWEGRVRSHVARVPLADRAQAFDARWSHELFADLTAVVEEDQARVIVQREVAALARALEAEALSDV